MNVISVFAANHNQTASINLSLCILLLLLLNMFVYGLIGGAEMSIRTIGRVLRSGVEAMACAPR